MKVVANTVAALVCRRERRGWRFLLLLRAPSRGGYWQSVSGKVRRKERAETAAVRETVEETGLRVKRVLDIDFVQAYYADRRVHLEPSFGVEVKEGEVKLSDEHVDWRWLTGPQALRLLRWPGNRAALARLIDELDRA